MQDKFNYKSTQNFRKTPKGVLTNLYSKMHYRSKLKNIDAPDFSLEEFHLMFLSDKKFIRLFSEWEKSGYEKALKPSIDRINNKKGYFAENIHIVSWQENRFKQSMERRSRKGKIIQLLNGEIVNIFNSQREAHKKLGFCQSMLSGALTGKYKQAYGFEWKYAFEHPELLEGGE